MKIIIWGSGKDAVAAYNILKNYHEVIAYAENNIGKAGENLGESIPIISCYKVSSLYNRDDNQISIVVPGSYQERTMKAIVKELLTNGIREQDIWVIPYNAMKEGKYDLVLWREWIHLYILNIRLADHCNLNCKRCITFANLYDESFYEFEQFEKDIERLHSLVSSISMIKLIGGEPLLNTDIQKFIKVTRKYYPYAKIAIVTNGILILTLSDEIWQCFRDNDIHIYITIYPPLHSKIDEIVAKIKRENVSVGVFRDGEEFGSFINMEGSNDPSNVAGKWFVGKCAVMLNGEIGRCGPAMTINKLNEKFNVSLPDNAKINLYDKNLDGSKLVDMLEDSIDLCKYCNGCIVPMKQEQLHKWEQDVKGQSRLEEWLL